MRVTAHIDEPVRSLLDVGCNVGAWLGHCRQLYPEARLAGVDINDIATAAARVRVPGAEIHRAGAEALPFPDASFQYVTCTEVLEHLPSELRASAFQEMRRVLVPGGRLIMTVPHAGWFAWLDSNNVRLRLPGLYRGVVGSGGRDATYAAADRRVEWHYHFRQSELEQLAGSGWRRVAVHHGGLFVFPLMDWLSWPFYRMGRPEHWLRRAFERIAELDYALDFGKASYGVLIVLERADDGD